MSDVRVLTTPQLITAAHVGSGLGLNRQLDYDQIRKNADPNGFHVFEVILPFHEAHDKSLPAHHRVMGMIKIENRFEGQEVIFDVPTEYWDKYMTPEVFSNRVKSASGIDLDLNVSVNA